MAVGPGPPRSTARPRLGDDAIEAQGPGLEPQLRAGPAGCIRCTGIDPVQLSVDLALAGVDAGSEQRRIGVRRRRSRARRQRGDQHSGRSRPSANPLATARPTRRPVKLPGPRPQAMPRQLAEPQTPGAEQVVAERQQGSRMSGAGPLAGRQQPPAAETQRHPRARTGGVERQSNVAWRSGVSASVRTKSQAE